MGIKGRVQQLKQHIEINMIDVSLLILQGLLGNCLLVVSGEEQNKNELHEKQQALEQQAEQAAGQLQEADALMLSIFMTFHLWIWEKRSAC